MRISDWSSDVCSSDIAAPHIGGVETAHQIGGAFAGGEALVEVLGVEEVIDENEGVARIGARVETDRRSRPIDRAFALDLVIERARSEEHTSELQSLMRISYAVFCLKKKKNKQ